MGDVTNGAFLFVHKKRVCANIPAVHRTDMSPDTASEVKFEIGHVLFIDIVAYSQLLITQQSQQLDTLKQIVRGTEQLRAAEAEGKLLRLPTGDGGALVFRTTPEAPVLCALEIARRTEKPS